MGSCRATLFRKRQFAAEIIVTCVRWYLRFSLSLRDVEELMASLCQLDLAHFDTLIWPPGGTKRSPVPLSALGGPGRSEALRRVFCGASRAERRPGLPRASDQNIGCGTLPSGSNT